MRAHMVLLSGRGYSVPEIAKIHDCGCDVVRTWLKRYGDEGPDGLEDEQRSGRPPKDPLAKQIVGNQASQSPRCSGYVHSRWTVKLLRIFLLVRFGLVLSCSSVRRYLKADDYRWARPCLAPASVLSGKKDPEAKEKMALIAAAAPKAAKGEVRLLYLDECDLHLLPVIRGMWMRGPRVHVPTPGQNAKRALFGALDAKTGNWHFAEFERKLAVNFVTFLEQLASAYPDDQIVLAMDNVRMHSAKVVQAWLAKNPRVQVLWLPKYEAHKVNPVERIWGLMKDAIAANRLAGSIDELTEFARRYFTHDLQPHPVDLDELAALPKAA